jgi:hypothetical protein
VQHSHHQSGLEAEAEKLPEEREELSQGAEPARE